ncbi:MAG: diguanylate cyclase [Deltaproteobacteria bacterium]|nr:diguanylate cyclase [Myxococcales bacterium]MDP3214392.1 diguanylate cyclase [Deltaproteobacteria bacterium]
MSEQGRVLVVDAEPMVQELVRRRLGEAGFGTVAAASGQEALAAAEGGGVDVILLSAALPDGDGLDVLARLRAMPSLEGVSIALMATQRDAESLRRGLAQGADDYLRKPIDRVELTARVQALLRLRRHLAELRRKSERLEELNAALERLATRDALTGVANRGSLEARLAEEVDRWWRYRQPLSVVLLDVDHFKRVNDTHGHGAGDAVLRGVAETLAGAVRKVDFVARYGGEEFVVVAPSTDAAGARILAERVRAAVAGSPVEAAGLDGAPVTVTVTVSLGVVTLPGVPEAAAMRPADLLARADKALYRAKQGGRNRAEVAE